MPPIERADALPLTRLSDIDLANAHARVVEAGWNQVPADWQLFLALGEAWGTHAADGSLPATAAVLPYAGGFGWISMVLVAQSWQRRGLATRLLDHCIGRLRTRSLVSVLDATPAGREVYRRLGFVDGWAISRWHRASSTTLTPTPARSTIRPILPHDLPAIVALDADAFGCARPQLLERLYARSTGFTCMATDASGRPSAFLLGRDGRNASQLGPLVAQDEETAIALIDHALARNPGPLMIDVLDRHSLVARALEARGFAIQRLYTRMTLDRERPFGDGRLMIAIAGPELG